MKKIQLDDFSNFIDKLEESENGNIKIAKVDDVINHLLNDYPKEKLEICIIPGFGGHALMLYNSLIKTEQFFEFIVTPSSITMNYIALEHIDRLYLYSDCIFMFVEE